MFCLWMCLSLFYVLQSRVSSDQVVSLTCNQTVNVTFGANVTLKCFINSAQEEECPPQNPVWCTTNGTKLCNTTSTKYTCDLDLSYVSLTISNVQEEENFTAEIVSNCGMAKSQPIRVQLLHGGPNPTPSYSEEQEEESSPVTDILLCASAAVAAVVILYFLYRSYRHRVNGRTYTAAGSFCNQCTAGYECMHCL